MSSSCFDIGEKLYSRLHLIRKLFSSLNHQTVIHGDFKISNVFISKTDATNSSRKSAKGFNVDKKYVYGIDWQWMGFGNAALDIAYFIATSIHHEILQDQFILLKTYHQALCEDGVRDYPFDLFYRDFKICWIDFFYLYGSFKMGTHETK